MKKSSLLGTVCAGFLCIAASPVWASAIYIYTGSNFDTFNNTSGNPPSHDATMNVTVTLEYAGPLLPNLSEQVVIPDTFSISDGINSIDNTNWTGGLFRVGTDSSGNINSWFIWTTASPGSGISWYIETINSSSISLVWDFGRISTNAWADTASISDAPGTWSVVPIPPALWLFGSGLLGLIGVARRKARA
jgi:hypothetical protein